MLNVLKHGRSWGCALAVTLLMASGAAADSWLRPASDGRLGKADISAAQAPRVEVLGYDNNGIRLVVDAPGVALLPYRNASGAFIAVTWPGAAPFGEVGAPLLPVIRRLFVAPPGASTAVSTALGETAVIDGATLGVAVHVQPRQAPIPKLPGARENAPFDFDPAAYAIDAAYLAEPATIEELGTYRGQRLFLLEVHPVAYNPVAQTIAFRPRIEVDIKFAGGSAGFVASSRHPAGSDRLMELNPDDFGRALPNDPLCNPTCEVPPVTCPTYDEPVWVF